MLIVIIIFFGIIIKVVMDCLTYVTLEQSSDATKAVQGERHGASNPKLTVSQE